MVNLSTAAQGLIKPQTSFNLILELFILNTDTIKIYICNRQLFMSHHAAAVVHADWSEGGD